MNSLILKNAVHWCSILAIAALCAGCGGGGQSTNKPAETGATDAGVWKPTGSEGKITGKISFSGQAPRLKPILMEADAVCARKHAGPVYPEVVVTNANGTLRNVFVYVKSGLEGKIFSVPDEPVTLDQQGCIYKPHVLGIQARQKLRIVSSDDTAHNIHPLPRQNREWNISQAAGAGPIMQSFNQPEVSIPVKCNQHAWMRAYVHVLSHPFYAVTGEDGGFEIKGLPPGNYEIEALQEHYGALTQSVKVAANQTVATDFTYKTAQARRPGSLVTLPAIALACCGAE